MHDKIFLHGGLKKRCCRVLSAVLAGCAILTSFSGCSSNLNIKEMLHPAEPTVMETQPTEPPATIPPDGDPENISCKGSYTTGSFDGSQVVAEIEDQKLTNSQLSILYQLAVNGCQPEEGDPAPDFEKPLDTQLCPLEGDHVTWQQYFLQQAIDQWHAVQTLERRSHMPMVQNEEFFEPSQEKHDQYMKDMPINTSVLYTEDASFRLHKKDKAYLDGLNDTLLKLAQDQGHATLQEMLNEEFGAYVTEKEFQDLMHLVNYAYLYFVSLTYHQPTEEEIRTELGRLPAADGQLVDFRHLLVYGEEATVGIDGKISADTASWEEAHKTAEELVKKFQSRKKQDDVAFSVLVHDNTRDESSRETGGLFQNVRKGQTIEPLDGWLFDASRKPGDVGIVKSDYGWHILYLKDQKDIRTPEAELAVKERKLQYIMEECDYNYPMTLDYTKIQLPEPAKIRGSLTMAGDLLYQDIGHERFPEVPVYIQQDYPKAMYGGYKLMTHGCGISAFAMLSTYMTDELHTPATLAKQFGRYNGLHGTDWKMFTEAPPELGYFLYDRSSLWKDVEAGLKDNRMSISLQVKGYFTRAGHYLVISDLLEDGKVVIRDSNLYNYTRLREHKEDRFNPQKLLPNCQGFWIYDHKVVTVPGCSRCGNPMTERAPRLFRENDYLCHKCLPAMERRAAFLDLASFN